MINEAKHKIDKTIKDHRMLTLDDRVGNLYLKLVMLFLLLAVFYNIFYFFNIWFYGLDDMNELYQMLENSDFNDWDDVII
jgi:hypothetical protein